MQNKLSPFQLILFVVLVFVIITAVIMFSLQRAKGGGEAAQVTMWGTIDKEIMVNLQNQLNDEQKGSINLSYTQKSPETFESEMVEALASGNAPDIFLLPDTLFYRQQNKLRLIPFESYPERDFKTNFIEGSEVLLSKEGILGLPFTIDPLVLYWNRSKLNTAGVSNPPQYWDEFIQLVPSLVNRDSSLNISDAAVALGEFQNIKNAKSIFLTLVMQAGNPIVVLAEDSSEKEAYQSTFADRFGFTVRPADAALNFYAQFSDASKEVYTWNRSLPSSDEMFLANDLAFYLGFASEYKTFLQRNPNLNFDVAVIPQSKSSETNRTFGKFQFLTITRNTPNIANAFNAVYVLTSASAQQKLAAMTDLPPIRRDLLSQRQDDSVDDIFYRSALIGNAFIDPNPSETTKIISDMIESYTSGRTRLTEAVDKAGSQFKTLITN